MERVVSAMVDRRVAVSVRGMDGLLGSGGNQGVSGAAGDMSRSVEWG